MRLLGLLSILGLGLADVPTDKPSRRQLDFDDSSLPGLNGSLRWAKRGDNRPDPNQLNGLPPMQWKFLTYKGPNSPPPYGPREFRRDSGGEGVNIFVLDSGFNNIRELARGGRQIHTWYPPNSLFAREVRNPGTGTTGMLMPAAIDDRTGHGSMMASAAGGKTLWIAPNANLYLVKTWADYKDNKGKIWGAPNVNSWNAVFDYVIGEIDRQWKKGPTRNVVTTSQNSPATTCDKDDEFTRPFQSFIDKLDGYETPFIASAGNLGWDGKSLADTFPPCLGKPDNNVVTVGGVNMDGTLWQPTTPAKNSGLKHDIWAPATGVDTMTSEGRVYKGDNGGGTSIAAAITAGTFAWFLGLDQCEADDLGIDLRKLYSPHGDPKVMAFKKLLVDSSYQRSSRIIGANEPAPTYALPEKVNAIYNLAQGSPPGRGGV